MQTRVPSGFFSQIVQRLPSPFGKRPAASHMALATSSTISASSALIYLLRTYHKLGGHCPINPNLPPPKGATMTRAIAAVGIALAMLFYVGMTGGLAQHGHHHPPQDEQLHDKFYSSWMRPDNRNISCCSKADCYPTAARMTEFGTWQAKRREDGKWLNVQPEAVETERDNPDGQPHLCAPPPDRERAYRNGVICFQPGAGT